MTTPEKLDKLNLCWILLKPKSNKDTVPAEQGKWRSRVCSSCPRAQVCPWGGKRTLNLCRLQTSGRLGILGDRSRVLVACGLRRSQSRSAPCLVWENRQGSVINMPWICRKSVIYLTWIHHISAWTVEDISDLEMDVSRSLKIEFMRIKAAVKTFYSRSQYWLTLTHFIVAFTS